MWRSFQLASIGLVVLIAIFPLYWAFVTAVRPRSELLVYPPKLLDMVGSFGAFEVVLTERALPLWLMNSAIVTSVSLGLALGLSVLAGYSLARYQTSWSMAVGYFLLSARMIPSALLAVPLFVIFKEWGILDTRMALIIAYTTFEIPFATWMMMGYFRSIPTELEQAARVDGATRFGAFRRVTLPIAGPGIAAAGIASATLAWSDYEFARGLLSSPSNWTFTVGIHSFFGEHVIHWNEIMASSIISLLPILVLYLAAQRYIISGLAAGAVKG